MSTELIRDGARSFLPLSSDQAQTVRAQGGPLFLLPDGSVVLELRDGPACRAFAGEYSDVQPVVTREGKR